MTDVAHEQLRDLHHLVTAFVSPAFTEAQAVTLLGGPVAKQASRWRLEPRNPAWSGITLHFEDLAAGTALLTTIDIDFAVPWLTDLAQLQRWFGERHRWLPRLHLHDPEVLAFDVATDLRVAIDFSVRRQPAVPAGLIVSAVMLRRFFPSPAR